MSKKSPRFLLINPWIHDFAAFDFWAKPLGLLKIATLLIENRIEIDFIDCLDYSQIVSYPDKVNPPKKKTFGRSSYPKEHITKPEVLKDVPRFFSRYGIPPSIFEDKLSKLVPPDAILVTSFMTYWYPGVRETIDILKKWFNEATIILGGIYPTLCRDHAEKTMGADHVISGQGEKFVLDFIKDKYGVNTNKFNSEDMNEYPIPAYFLYNKPDSALIETSRGCPYNCLYCSSRYIVPTFKRKKAEKVFEEIIYLHNQIGIENFAFADDALLLGSDFEKLLELIAKSKIQCRFHTPNGIHASMISGRIAELMYINNFKELKIGVESMEDEFHHTMDHKLTSSDLFKAVNNLKNAGFKIEDIGAYVLIGLPMQTYEECIRSIDMVGDSGIKPYLSQFSPIPKSPLFEKACKSSVYDIASDPIFHNNSILPMRWDKFDWNHLFKLKTYIKRFY
jgi:radical SAM superfamily enzyme YgiQ (UPF0313 family)